MAALAALATGHPWRGVAFVAGAVVAYRIERACHHFAHERAAAMAKIYRAQRTAEGYEVRVVGTPPG